MKLTNKSTIAIVGVGLIGGSCILALRKRGFKGNIHGLVRDVPRVQATEAGQACDILTDDPVLAIAKADIVMLAVPLHVYETVINNVVPLMRPQAILTDVGSVKFTPYELMAKTKHEHIVPAHPIAGKEEGGPEHADPRLFVGKKTILTDLDETDDSSVITHLWESCGSNVIRMNPLQHDEIYAYVSHLPQFVAFNLPKALQEVEYVPNSPMWHFTRLCRSPHAVWEPIFSMNERYVTEAAQRFWHKAGPVANKYGLKFPTVAGWLAGHREAQAVELTQEAMQEIAKEYATAMQFSIDNDYQSFGGTGLASVMQVLEG